MDYRLLKQQTIFAHSAFDAFLLLITLAQLGVIVWGAIFFSRLTYLEISIYSFMYIYLTVTHYQVVIHNFVHNPFFSVRSLNSIYAVIGSIPLMASCTLFGLDHLNHHRFVNDRIDLRTGQTGDPTSTYRFGENGQHEKLWRYAVLMPLRELAQADAYKRVEWTHAPWQIGAEITALSICLIALFVFNFRFALFYILLVYIGQVMACAANYVRHFGAVPEDSRANSISCYNAVYNFLWFNNGYHQEHHCRPGVHWTEIKKVRAEMLPDKKRKIANWAHFTNMPSRMGF